MLTELKEFFENHPLAQKAADSIKNGREIAVVVTKGGHHNSYTFAKENGRNIFRDGGASKPDLTFTIPEASAQELVTKKFDTVGQVGLHIFEKMLSNDPSHKIHAKIHAGFLGLMTGGYLGVLTAGGTEVAKFLAAKGLGSAGKIKDTISKMRG